MIKKSFGAFLLLVTLTTPVLAQNQSSPDNQPQRKATSEDPEFSIRAAEHSATKEQALANLQRAEELFSRQGNEEGVQRVKDAISDVDKIPFSSNKKKLIWALQHSAEDARKAGNQEAYQEMMQGVSKLQQP